MTGAAADILLAGKPASGTGFVLQAPISFWGGVDPDTGTIIDQRHPDLGKSVARTVLFLPGTIGSSSASSVMLELVRNGKAPAALVFDAPDAILILGLVAAREMGWPPPPALKLGKDLFADFDGHDVRVSAHGYVSAETVMS